MISVPDDLTKDPTRWSAQSAGVWVVDYAATTPSLSLPVAVTKPTFIFIHKGTKELVSGDRTLLAESGSLVAVRTGTYVMSDLLPGVKRYASTILSVDRDVLRPLIPAPRRTERTDKAVVVDVDAPVVELAADLRRRIDGCVSLAEKQLAAKQVLVSVLLDETVRTLVGGDVFAWTSSRADQVHLIMSEHCYRPLRLDQYASMCAMSVSSFKRAFGEVYDASPGQWLIETRLRRAAELLESTSRSVTDISRESGFGDPSNFTRAFSKRFDAPPTAFRRKAWAKHAS